MAILQGARLRTVALPASHADSRARSIAHPAAGVTPRLRPTGLLMAAILAGTMLGLVYLTQTLASNATSSEIRDLTLQREEIGRQLRNQALAVETWADPVEVGRKVRELGLQPLGDPVVLAAP